MRLLLLFGRLLFVAHRSGHDAQTIIHTRVQCVCLDELRSHRDSSFITVFFFGQNDVAFIHMAKAANKKTD